MRTIVGAVLLVAVTLGASGCVSFSGPGDLRRQIAASAGVTLSEQEGVCVGPLGVALAGLVAGPFLPVPFDGVTSVDFGSYEVSGRRGATGEVPCLRGLRLDGWEPVVRVHEPGSDVLVLAAERGARGTTLRGLLFLQQSGDRLQVVRVRGDFDRILGNLLDSDLLGDFDPADLALGLAPPAEERATAP